MTIIRDMNAGLSQSLGSAARELAEKAAASGVRSVLVGGFAMQHYCPERLTANLDFAASGPLPHLPHLGELPCGGHHSVGPGGVPVKWILRKDDYQALFEEAVARPAEGSGAFAGLPVVGPEYLAAMKLVARRLSDQADLELLVLSGRVEVPLARSIIKGVLGAYAADAWDRAVALARWRAEREKAWLSGTGW